MRVGENIRRLRKSMGLTQVQLAKRSGLSQSGISDIEKSVNNPSTETIRLIATALGVSVSDLIDTDKNKETAPENGDSLKAEGVFILNGLSDDGLKQAVNYLRYLSKSEDTK